MKNYTPKTQTDTTLQPKWAKGLKTTIQKIDKQMLANADFDLSVYLKMARARREKWHQESQALAANTFCRD